MRKPRIAHGLFVGLADPAAIAAGQRCRDRAGRAIKVAAHVPRKAALQPGKQVALITGSQNLDRPENASGGRNPAEPGAAGKIVPARQHWRCGRNQPRPQAHQRTFGDRGAIIIQVKIEPHLDCPFCAGLASSQQQTD
ncbi:MAG TPA: hypothetical protein VFV30_05770, partial [Novosphingobium sp.]|nr:hypothetical protein [Novosphingobium sp.]